MKSRIVIATMLMLVLHDVGSYDIDREVNECSYLRDIKIDNKSVYAPPSGSADLSDADINLPIRFHVFMEHGPQATALVTWIDQWITNQSIINQSLISSSIGVNVLEDIRFKLYFPTSFNSLTNRTNLYALYRNLDGITFLNQSEWKKSSDTYIIEADNYNKSTNPASDPYAFCTGAAVEVLLNATEEIWDSTLYDTSCPANFSQSCHDSYWEHLCIYKLRRTDIFKYLCDYGNITVKLFNQTGSKVFESTQNKNDFTLPDPGAYTVKIQTNDSARIRYNIISNCKDIRAYFDHLMKLDINTTTVNVFLTGVRIKPYIYGRYEFITQSPISSGALMMIKWFDSIDSLDYFWRYLAEAFGADIQRENDSPSCKQLHTRLNNDTIIALHQPEKIRCNLYNSNDPFGKNFNRTKINITKADGKITTLYIPSSKISGSNHSLYCDKTKMCVWDVTPNKTNHTKLISATSVTATSMEQCFGGNKWCERRSSPVLSTAKSITTSMQPIPNLISCLDTTNIVVSKSSTILRPTVTHCKDDNHNTKSFITEMKIIFGFFDDVSSLNYEDIALWVWSKAQTSVTNSCIHKRTIKATIKINDINRLSRDLVLVQYQLRNGQLYLKDYQVCIMKIVSSYDCDEKVENMCHLQKFRLETWQVISFAFSSIVGIIDVVLAICIWRCCH